MNDKTLTFPARRLAIMAIIFIGFAVYLPKIGNGFIFDDQVFIQGDESIRSISNIPSFFLTDQSRLYRPIRSAIYSLVYALFNYQTPAYHLAGITFHIIISVSFFLILEYLGLPPLITIIAALVFAVHPLHSDRVVNITGSFDLAGLALAYAGMAIALGPSGIFKTILSSLLFALGLFGSEEAATIPLLIVACSLPYRKKDVLKVTSIRTCIFFVLLAFYLTARFLVLKGVTRVAEYPAGGLWNSIVTTAPMFFMYLGKSIIPFGLRPDYGVILRHGADLHGLIALAGLAALAITCIAAVRRAPAIYFAGVFFFIGLLPFSNLLPTDTIAAERYFYHGLAGPSIFIGVLFAYGLPKDKKRMRLYLILSCVVLFLFGALTINRTRIWSSAYTLWDDAAKKDPYSYLARLNRGNELQLQGKLLEAQTDHIAAKSLRPNLIAAKIALGGDLVFLGKLKEAEEEFYQALKLDPASADAAISIAQVKVISKDYDNALRIALKLYQSGDHRVAVLNVLGYISAQTNHISEAKKYYEEILRVSGNEEDKKQARHNIDAISEMQN